MLVMNSLRKMVFSKTPFRICGLFFITQIWCNASFVSKIYTYVWWHHIIRILRMLTKPKIPSSEEKPTMHKQRMWYSTLFLKDPLTCQKFPPLSSHIPGIRFVGGGGWLRENLWAWRASHFDVYIAVFYGLCMPCESQTTYNIVSENIYAM